MLVLLIIVLFYLIPLAVVLFLLVALLLFLFSALSGKRKTPSFRTKPQSRIGNTSLLFFAAGMATEAIWICCVNGSASSYQSENVENLLICAGFLPVAVVIVGIFCGLRGVLQEQRSRLTAAIGLGLNIAGMLLFTCGMWLLG